MPRRHRTAAAMRRLLAAGAGLHQLDVRNRGDCPDDVLRPGVRRDPQGQLDLIAALPDSLAVDAGHLDASIRHEPGDVAERLQPADFQPESDEMRARSMEPGDER